jgi:hypothetical protein
MLRRYFLSLLPAWLFHDCTRHADSAGNTRVQVGTAGTHIWLRAHATDPGRIQLGDNGSIYAQDNQVSVQHQSASLRYGWVNLYSDGSSGSVRIEGSYPTGPFSSNHASVETRGTSSGATVSVAVNGSEKIAANATGIGFYGASPVAKPTVTGSRGGNAALGQREGRVA